MNELFYNIGRIINYVTVIAFSVFGILNPEMTNFVMAKSVQNKIKVKIVEEQGDSNLIEFSKAEKMNQYIENCIDEISGIEISLDDVNCIGQDVTKEYTDNGGIIYIKCSSEKKLKENLYIKRICPDFSRTDYKGFDIEGIALRNDGGNMLASVYGHKVFGTEEKLTDSYCVELEKIVEDEKVHIREISYNRELNSKHKSKVYVQVPLGDYKHNSLSVDCLTAQKKKMGTVKVTQYIYKGKKSGKKAIDSAITSFIVSPTSNYAVTSFHGAMSTGINNTIIDESCLDSTSDSITYTLGGSVSSNGGTSASVSLTNSFSIGNMSIINSFADAKKKLWKCTPQSKVKEQARKIEPGIVVRNENINRNLTKFESSVPYVCFTGLLPWSATDVISVTGYVNRK